MEGWGNFFLGPPPTSSKKRGQRKHSADHDGPADDVSASQTRLTKSATTPDLPSSDLTSPTLHLHTTSSSTSASTSTSTLHTRVTRSLSHESAPQKPSQPSPSAAKAALASRPAIPQRLRHRSQSTSHAGSAAISKDAKDKPRRQKRGNSSAGYLVGLGGYDASEYRQYIRPKVPALPSPPDAAHSSHTSPTDGTAAARRAETALKAQAGETAAFNKATRPTSGSTKASAAADTMPSSVKTLGKQPKGSGSGSSLLFGPARTSTTSSGSSANTPNPSANASGATLDVAPKSPAAPRLRAGSVTAGGPAPPLPSGQSSAQQHFGSRNHPVFRHEGGRRWLRDPTLPYPLPVDLEELHRQSLRLVMMMRLFGRPFLNDAFLVAAEQETQRQQSLASPLRQSEVDGKASGGKVGGSTRTSGARASGGGKPPPPPPKQPPTPSKGGLRQNPPTPRSPPQRAGPLKVLEIGCGAGLWSSACHDYLQRRGIANVQFTGVDIAPLAPDLRKQGVAWRFVQWDMRKLPWPFEDGEFDLLFINDVSFTMSSVQASSSPVPESTRLLRPGGVVEIWESDHVFRTLLPNPQLPPGTSPEKARQAETCGVHVINASTPFAAAQNRFLTELNAWMTDALVGRDLPPSPCGLAEWALRADPDTFRDVGSWRLAVPFEETRWESQAGRKVTTEQKALRRTALLTTLQLVAGLEPILRQSSEKRQDEWNRWWAAGLRDLLEDKGLAGGECLELGAWWATRV